MCNAALSLCNQVFRGTATGRVRVAEQQRVEQAQGGRRQRAVAAAEPRDQHRQQPDGGGAVLPAPVAAGDCREKFGAPLVAGDARAAPRGCQSAAVAPIPLPQMCGKQGNSLKVMKNAQFCRQICSSLF